MGSSSMSPWRYSTFSDAVAEGLFAADFDHFGTGVDGDDLFGTLGEQQREGAFAGAEVGDDQRGHEAEEGFGHALPGFAGDVVLAEAAGDGVEEGCASCPGACGGRGAWRPGRGASGISALGAGKDFVQGLPSVGTRLVEAALAGAAVFDEAGLLELREVGGDGALAHGEDLLQLGDGELLARRSSRMRSRLGSATTRRIFTIEGIIAIDAGWILIHINISRFDDVM
jgi:hypothetical protein